MPPWKGEARPLSHDAFAQAAERIGCDVPAIRAVWDVEAAGKHFLPDGSVIRRFEPHHFPKDLWSQIGFIVRKGEAPWRASLRQSSEDLFQRAYAVDPDAALAASSWGAPQIMAGMNHEAAGFDSPRAMVEHMAKGADQQLGAFVQLIEAWGLDSAIRAHDWLAFARRYNGSGQPEVYARKMEAAYRRHSGTKSARVLRVGDRGAAVKRLQGALGIKADGAFGPQTLSAVEAFQREAGLPVDGIAGARTWAAIEQEEGAEPPKQEVTADKVQREVGRWVGVTSALGAAATTMRDAFADIPEPLLWGLVAAALAGGVLWLWKRRSA